MPLINSSSYTALDASYWLNVYRVYGLFYSSRSLGLLGSLLNIKISIDRLHLIKSKYIVSLDRLNTETNSKRFKILSLVFVLTAFGINTPKMFFVKIFETVNNSTDHCLAACTQYKAVILQDSSLAIFSHILAIYLTHIPLVVVLIVLNSILISNVNKKKECYQNGLVSTRDNELHELRRTGSSQPEIGHTVVSRRGIQHKTTRLIIYATALHSIDQLVLIIVNLFLIINQEKSFYTNRLLTFFIHFSLLVSHSSNIIIYYAYNRQFSICLKNIMSFFRLCKNQ
jgi:hypothetical protein